MWKLLNIAVTIFCTGILWYLQELPDKPSTWYDQFLHNHKNEVFICALLSSLLVQVIFHLLNEFILKNKRKEWINNLLEHIVKEHLGGRNYQTRVSILRPTKGIKLWPIYLTMPISYKYHDKKLPGWKTYWSNFPSCFKKYLYVYARYGHSDRMKSYTLFPISDRNEEPNGVADKCYKEEADQSISTTCISHTYLPPTFKQAERNMKIKKYMKDTYISNKNYSVLLAMNTRANNIYAAPIFNEKQRIWGVLIIDNDSESAKNYKSEMDQYIADYQNIFSYTLNILKQ